MKLNILAAGLGLAFVASAVSAEEAKPEVKAERRVIVIGGDHAKMDKNGDGEVSRDEFMALHSEMFAKLDADKNGRLSKAERESGHEAHLKALRGGDHAMVLRGPHGPGERRAHRIELHHAGEGPGEMDANKDGKISPEEFTAPMKKAFESLDADKSGFLEEGERAHGPMRFERRVEVKPEAK